MTVLNVRKVPTSMVFAMADMINKLRRAVAAGTGSAVAHNAVTAVQGSDPYNPSATNIAAASANASDLATSITLGNEIRGLWLLHLADAVAHKAADGTNTLAAPVATDLATGITLANEIKADYNLHRASTTFHNVADGTNVIAAADATDQGSLNTLLNELKTDMNAHYVLALSGTMINFVSP